MITQTQFPFRDITSPSNDVFKGLAIGLIVVGIIVGLYFSIRAVQNIDNSKQM